MGLTMKSVLWPEQIAAYRLARAFGFMDVPTPEQMQRTINDARKVLGDALIAGGVAVGYYGWKRITQDVDLLYSATDGTILARLRKDFRIVIKANSGWHELAHRKTKVRLELIPEGGIGTYGFIPGPRTVGGRDGMISLLGLSWMKLVSGRSKDITDLVEIAKSQLDEMRSIQSGLPPELQPRFAEALAQAQKELDYDPHHENRGGAQSAQEAAPRYGKVRKPKAAAKGRKVNR